MALRATIFQGEAKRNVSDWATHIDFQFARGETNKSWNTAEDETYLFNMHGPFDLRKLATNLENLSTYPNTQAYANGTIPTNKYIAKAAKITLTTFESVQVLIILAIIGTVARIRPKKKE